MDGGREEREREMEINKEAEINFKASLSQSNGKYLHAANRGFGSNRGAPSPGSFRVRKYWQEHLPGSSDCSRAL